MKRLLPLVVAAAGLAASAPAFAQYGYGYRGVSTVRCESNDNRMRLCRVDIRRQLSDTNCREGYNWGAQRDGVWVERGCRAEFVVY